jgi:diketogulonate reductase-like aldo/keto reductase
MNRKVPEILYGTAWKEEDTERCVREALDAGYRGIDTANQRKHYFEAGVGVAVGNWWDAGKGTRSDLFLQTKFTYVRGQDHRLPYDPRAPLAAQVAQSVASSLEHFHTDYFDSYVLHGPYHPSGLAPEDSEVWAAMEALHAEGKVKALGLSNASLEQLRLFYDEARVKPSYVQNRCYARRGWDHEIRQYCRERNIVYQGFSLLTANPQVLESARLGAIARRLSCTPAQVVFCFARQVGMLPLTGTTDPLHMKEDLEAGKLSLSAEELTLIEGMR